MVEVMFIPASSDGKPGFNGWTAAEEFPQMAGYIHRASYMLSQGRPTAQIAVYYPTTSMWLGNSESNKSTLHIMQQLLENQRDFDFVDEVALSSTLILEKGRFFNLSGQQYSSVIIPSVSAISKNTLDRLQLFASEGGQVIILGSEPSIMVEKTFLHASEPPDLGWAIHDSTGELNTSVMAVLPLPDVSFNKACPAVKYIHRSLRNAELYFFFNESEEKQSFKTDLEGKGQIQLWDAMTGKIEVLPAIGSEKGYIQFLMEMKPYEAKFIILGNEVLGM
jgi:hypothetical protein